MITNNISPREVTSQFRITEHVFNRFEIDSFSQDKILNNTALTEINPDFLVDVLNVFCNYKEVDIDMFSKYSVLTIIDYLERSHNYYRSKILPEIGQSISNLLNNYPEHHALKNVLHKFYFKYKVDLETHFKEEEEGIFLYAKKLYKAVYFRKELSFLIEFFRNNSINHFIEEHSDTIAELYEVICVLSRYKPPETNASSFRILLEKLHYFEHDLNIHAFIEDRVLICMLLTLEQKLNFEINN
ncbi:hypothetical protein [Tamlana crocina]|uniref:Hemerythrin-like domain-containing protein n=1 Tax=Tamlana crocina TaxID=393006 RepID=A0ABX1DBX3_9FLAO|nr:hypothetical protein [Tamlana crocina]NJX14706.1 hypothetical protein [Tamlana crocina]